MARSVAFGFAVLLAVFEIGSCMRCYQCNSQSDRTCGDPFSANRNVVDCSLPESYTYNQAYLKGFIPDDYLRGVTGAPRYCHKIVMNTGTVIRTCLDTNPNNMNQTCQLLDGTSRIDPDMRKHMKHCSVCDRDSCNGASSIVSSIPLAVLAVVASYVYYKQ